MELSLSVVAVSLMLIELYAGVMLIASPVSERTSVADVSMLAVPLASVWNVKVAVRELPVPLQLNIPSSS